MTAVTKCKQDAFCTQKHNPPTYAVVTIEDDGVVDHYCIDCWVTYTQDIANELTFLYEDMAGESI